MLTLKNNLSLPALACSCPLPLTSCLPTLMVCSSVTGFPEFINFAATAQPSNASDTFPILGFKNPNIFSSLNILLMGILSIISPVGSRLSLSTTTILTLILALFKVLLLTAIRICFLSVSGFCIIPVTVEPFTLNVYGCSSPRPINKFCTYLGFIHSALVISPSKRIDSDRNSFARII